MDYKKKWASEFKEEGHLDDDSYTLMIELYKMQRHILY